MINQQLLEYIRQQFATGLSKENIAKSLIASGWQVSDINDGFAALEKPSIPIVSAPLPQSSMPIPIGIGIENTIWSKRIPRTNMGFMIVSLLLVFGLDLAFIINEPDLISFWVAMLVVLCIFGIFFYCENYVFKKRFSSSQSKLDTWISVLAVIRNLVFVLNFIPYIQILGGIVLVFGGIPYIIIYGILIKKRSNPVQAS